MTARTPDRLVLASASPRRLALLQQVGIIPWKVVAADIDETSLPKELPHEYCLRTAKAKAHKIAPDYPDAFVLAADTVVACGRRILPKAENAEQVRDCLTLLSGRRHRVLNGIALVRPGGQMTSRLIETTVQFRRLTPEEVEAYISLGEGEGKAGGYGIQGRAAAFVKFIRGSHSTVVGLSLYDTMQMLAGSGFFQGE